MKRTLAALALTAVFAGGASAQSLELVEGAYEASLADVTFPSSIAGTLIFRMCAACDAIAMPVNSGTVYVGPRGPLTFEDFIDSAFALRQAPNGPQKTAVGIFYDLETKRVTRISLHPSASN